MKNKNPLPLLMLMGVSVFTSCNDTDKIEIKSVPVEIVNGTIPKTSTTNQNTGIELKAAAPNGCYRDLTMELVKVDEAHYLITAKGNYTTNSVCPQAIVEKDSVINFKPVAAGKYFFQTNKTPFEVRLDTLVVD